MHIHHPPTHSVFLNLSRSPALLPCLLLSVSLHRRCFFRRDGKRKRTIATEGNRSGGRAGKGKSTPNAISHAVEKRYSRVRLPRKSPPGIFAAGHLRARRSPLRSRENWERRSCVCVCVDICIYRTCKRARSLCACAERQGYGGYYFGVGLAKEAREIPGIDWSPTQSSGWISKRKRHGRKCEPYSISAVRLSRHFYRTRESRDVLLTSVYICYRDWLNLERWCTLSETLERAIGQIEKGRWGILPWFYWLFIDHCSCGQRNLPNK